MVVGVATFHATVQFLCFLNIYIAISGKDYRRGSVRIPAESLVREDEFKSTRWL